MNITWHKSDKIKGYCKAAVFCVLSLTASMLNAGAIRFFGLNSETKALAILSGMESDFGKGDCAAVSAGGDALFREKPSARTRKRAYEYLGQCYESQGLVDKAISVYKLGRGLYPDDSFFPERLAVLYLKAGFYSTAAPLFEELIKARPDAVEANAGLGKCYAETGFLARAKDYYSRAVILGDFKDMRLMKEYAWWMIKKRDWEEAELVLAKALELDPRDAGLYAALSRISAGRGDYKTAEKRMSAALELEPENRRFAIERALILLMAGEVEASASAADRVLKEETSDSFASLIKGMALYKKGDLAGAKAALAAAAKNEGAFAARIAGSLLAELDSKKTENIKRKE